MPPRKWRQPGYRLLAIFFATVFLLVCLLGWMGWRLVQQDRQLARQRLEERREHAADIAVTALKEHLSKTEALLTRLSLAGAAEVPGQADQIAGTLPEDSLLLLFSGSAAGAFPTGRLLLFSDGSDSPIVSPDFFSQLTCWNSKPAATSVLSPVCAISPDIWILQFAPRRRFTWAPATKNSMQRKRKKSSARWSITTRTRPKPSLPPKTGWPFLPEREPQRRQVRTILFLRQLSVPEGQISPDGKFIASGDDAHQSAQFPPRRQDHCLQYDRTHGNQDLGHADFLPAKK
jgi:hypothetical protein